MTIEELPPSARCPDCGTWLPRAALECPNCGRPRDLPVTGLPPSSARSRRSQLLGGAGAALALGVAMLWVISPHEGPGPTSSPPLGSGLAYESASPAPTPAGSPLARRLPDDGPVAPGRYYMCVLCGHRVRVHVTIPTGYFVAGGRPEIFKGDVHGIPTLTMLDVTHVMADVCADAFEEHWIEVGPTVADLTTAIASQVGLHHADPVDVMLGGFPAKKVELALDTRCPPPSRGQATLWAGHAPENAFWLSEASPVTAYIVDVTGERVVITTTRDLVVSGGDLAEVDAMVASIQIVP